MTHIIRDDIPLGRTYDSNGNLLTYKNSTGFWTEYTYDSNGNELTYKDSYDVYKKETELKVNGSDWTASKEVLLQALIQEKKEFIEKQEKCVIKIAQKLKTELCSFAHIDNIKDSLINNAKEISQAISYWA